MRRAYQSVQLTAPARSRPPLCSRVPKKGHVKCSLRSNIETKAAEFRALLTNRPRSPNETKEFRDLEQTYTRLAENEEWMAVNLDKTIQRRENHDNSAALVEEEEKILKFLGAAVLMRWNTIPTKLQQELFDCASTIGDLQETTPLGTDSSLPSQS